MIRAPRRSQHLPPELWQQIDALRDAGLGPRQIADRLGVSHFTLLKMRKSRSVALPDRPRPKIVPENYPPDLRAKLETPVAELGLRPALRDLLDRLGLLFVADLLAVSADDLLTIPGINARNLKGIYRALAQIGLHRNGRTLEQPELVA